MAHVVPAPEADAVERPRLVFFHSRRSGACRRVEAYIAQVLQRRRNHDTFTLLHVDVDERPELAERFGVTGVPTVVVVRERRVVGRLAEPRGCKQLERFLTPWLR